MTVRIRVQDFEFEDARINLGGRLISTNDILSVAIQKRVSAAFLASCLAGILFAAIAFTSQSLTGNIAGLSLAATAYFGARYEWQHPYVLVLHIYQLGSFEILGINRKSLPTILRYVESL